MNLTELTQLIQQEIAQWHELTTINHTFKGSKTSFIINLIFKCSKVTFKEVCTNLPFSTEILPFNEGVPFLQEIVFKERMG